MENEAAGKSEAVEREIEAYLSTNKTALSVAVLDTLEAFDPSSGARLTSLKLKVSALLFDGEKLWVAEPERNAVRSINVNTYELGSPIAVSRDPRLLAFDGKRLWVGNNDSTTLQFIRVLD